MTSGCGCLLWLLALLCGTCCPALAQQLDDTDTGMRYTRLCGNEFDKMYFSGSCDSLGKRSEWPARSEWPSEPRLQLLEPESGLELASPEFGRLQNTLLHRLSRSVWAAQKQQRRRRLWAADRLTPASPRHPVWQIAHTSKRSATKYHQLHELCCGKGCTEAHFRGLC